MKRMIAFLLILLMLPVLPSCKDTKVGRKGGFTFVYDSETQILTVSGKGKLSDFEPEDHGFGSVKKAVFKEGITHIDHSFGEDGPEEIVFPSSLEVIEDSFSYCEMEQMTVPKTVKTISEGSFQFCKIETLAFEGAIEIIHGECFEYLQTMRVIIPEGSTLCDAFHNSTAEEIVVEPNVLVHPCKKGCFNNAGEKILICEPILKKSGWSVLNRSDKYLPIIVPEEENWEDYLDVEPEIDPKYGHIFNPDGELIDTYVEEYMD